MSSAERHRQRRELSEKFLRQRYSKRVKQKEMEQQMKTGNKAERRSEKSVTDRSRRNSVRGKASKKKTAGRLFSGRKRGKICPAQNVRQEKSAEDFPTVSLNAADRTGGNLQNLYRGSYRRESGEYGKDHPPVRRLTAESVRRFQIYLYQEGKKESTIEKYLRDVKAFRTWLREEARERSTEAEEERKTAGGSASESGVFGGCLPDGLNCDKTEVEIFGTGSESGLSSGYDSSGCGECDQCDRRDPYSETACECTDSGFVPGLRYGSGSDSFDSGYDAVAKETARRWRDVLCDRGYAPVTVNAMLTSLNLFFRFLGWEECRTKTLRIQRCFFRSSERELARGEYEQLIRTAKTQGKARLALLIETIGATGIRVSEVKAVTVEAVRRGRAEISLKGKIRTILIPEKLRKKLLRYAEEKGIIGGEIFLTRSGRSLSRQQIWAEMKRLCPAAGVLESKVFPHNLRHLFARAFYRVSRDIVRLADVLGHSDIATTRIYLTSSGTEHARCLERLHLVSGR